jgi:hypothetical protein
MIHLSHFPWLDHPNNIWVMRTSYDSPHCATFPNFTPLPSPQIQIFSSAPCSQTPSVYVLPFVWETTEGNKLLGKPRRWWEDNVRMDARETAWELRIGFMWLKQGPVAVSHDHDNEPSVLRTDSFPWSLSVGYPGQYCAGTPEGAFWGQVPYHFQILNTKSCASGHLWVRIPNCAKVQIEIANLYVLYCHGNPSEVV